MKVLKESQGLAMIVVLMMMIVLLTATGASLFFSGLELRTASIYQTNSKAFYMAELGAEYGHARLVNLLNTTLNPTSADLAAITAPTMGGYTFSTFTVAPVGIVGTQPLSGNFAGLTAYVQKYRVTSTATRTGTSNSATVVVDTQDNLIPLFQFGIFYQNDLEKLPGPNMTFTGGRIHSNANIYVGSGAGSTLSVDSKVTSAGNIYNKRLDDGTIPPGAVQFKDGSGVYQAMNPTGGPILDSTNPNWATDSQTRWGGNVKSAVHGIQPLNLPLPTSNPLDLIQRGLPGDSQQLKDARFYWTAGVRIIDGTAVNQSGSPVALPANTLTLKTFYDWREQKTVQVREVDMGLLGSASPNGVVYISETQQGGGVLNAVRLVNGATLPSGGLTVASDNPVYIKGDYNTGATPAPAAIVSDTTIILSNSWIDSNSTPPGSTPDTSLLSNRVATNTTVNGAIMTGRHQTAGTQYSGGVENFPRFLENWSTSTFTYSGSLVNLWYSQQATGNWLYGGNVYQAPTRNWSYGMNPANLPPGVPKVRIVWKIGQMQRLN